jgi:hypothetical protein
MNGNVLGETTALMHRGITHATCLLGVNSVGEVKVDSVCRSFGKIFPIVPIVFGNTMSRKAIIMSVALVAVAAGAYVAFMLFGGKTRTSQTALYFNRGMATIQPVTSDWRHPGSPQSNLASLHLWSTAQSMDRFWKHRKALWRFALLRGPGREICGSSSFIGAGRGVGPIA